MRIAILVSIFFTIYGCSDTISKEDLQHLNGYWEIALVEFPNGETKEYGKVSPTIDYLKWDGSKGYRKKVHPKLDGTFDTSDDAEAFEILKNDGQFFMQYQNEMSAWKETLILLETARFSVVNEEGITYHYRRHEPIKILE